MTDTSLPNDQTPPTNSYVDSYAPPPKPVGSVPHSVNGTMPATAVSQPQSDVATPQLAVAKPQPQSAADPLAELEKALEEYEAKQKQQLANKSATVPSEAKLVGDKDPLAELEKVLNEYESNYKKRQINSTPTDLVTLPTTDSKEPPLTTKEYRNILKNEPVKSESSEPAKGEAIEEQNIFELLGVIDAQSAEKEAFLDELQQALWDDFLEKDLPLLVKEDQLKQITDLQQDQATPEEKIQRQLIKKVEELVPDIEEIMLEKALGLKEEMMWERIAGMKEHFAGNLENLTKITEAEEQLKTGNWKIGSRLLNSLLV